jgi:L-rhamnonate dehydratase
MFKGVTESPLVIDPEKCIIVDNNAKFQFLLRGPMKIVDVQALVLRMPEVDETRTDSSQDALIIKISTDSGIAGWGEVDGCPTVAKAIIDAPPSHTQVKGLRHLLLGEDPFGTEHLWKRLYEGTSYYGRAGAVVQAMAGIDIALWDIKGKALGKPIWALLGGKPGKLRAYSSNMFQLTVQATVERAKSARDAGYTAVKFGWEPFGRSGIDLDLRYLDAIKKVTGTEMDFMLDVGHVWDAKTAVRRCKAFEPYDLAWIEEPLHPDDYNGYAYLCEHAIQHIAAGEQECTVTGFDRLIREGRINVAQVDLSRCGYTQAMKIAAMAQRAGIKVANHCFTTDINVAAALHYLASIPNTLILEYGVEPGEIARSLARNPIAVIDGHVKVPEEPGLGVEPDPAVIEKYLVRD